MSGSLITILSGKGGCGKTILATNLAVVLSEEEASRVCLVDLDLARGDVASNLGLAPGPSLRAAMTADGHLNTKRLHHLLTPYFTGLDCLLAPLVPGEPEKVLSQYVEELLTALRSRYDYVVIDTPAQMSSLVLAAMDASDHHVLVTTPEIPAVNKLRHMLDMLDMLANRAASRSVLLNRADAAGSLTEAQVENQVRAPLAALLPTSPWVGVSINARMPLAASHPEHEVVFAIREFAAKYVAVPALASIGTPPPSEQAASSGAADIEPEAFSA